jgi:hypothetical protein
MSQQSVHGSQSSVLDPNVVVSSTATRSSDVEVLLFTEVTPIQQRENGAADIDVVDLSSLIIFSTSSCKIRVNRINCLRTLPSSQIMRLHVPQKKLDGIVIRRFATVYQLCVVH